MHWEEYRRNKENIARFEGGTRIPTLLMLEKYANALGKHIEVSIRDKE